MEIWLRLIGIANISDMSKEPKNARQRTAT